MDGRVVLISLLIEQGRECLDQDQVGGGRDVVVPAHLEEVPLGELAHTLLHIDTDGDNTILHRQVFHLGKEELGDGLKSLGRPWQEPIDRAAIDESREHS